MRQHQTQSTYSSTYLPLGSPTKLQNSTLPFRQQGHSRLCRKSAFPVFTPCHSGSFFRFRFLSFLRFKNLHPSNPPLPSLRVLFVKSRFNPFASRNRTPG